jgi:hypothetical protein
MHLSNDNHRVMIRTMMVVMAVMAIRLRISRNREEGDDSQEHHSLHTKLRCLPGPPAQAFAASDIIFF